MFQVWEAILIQRCICNLQIALSELEILKQCLKSSDYEKVEAKKLAAARLIEINHYKQPVLKL